MHTFAIISNSEDSQNQERQKILDRFKVTRFSQIRITDMTIAAVRNAQRLLQYKQGNKQFQALIIEHAEQFSVEAQQALLKTLEEPPENTIIILEAYSQDQILKTILSRAQIIYKSGVTIHTLQKEREITSFWAKTIKSNSITIRLNASSETATGYPERADFSNWIDNQIVFFRSLLIKRVGSISSQKTLTPKNIATILKLLLFAKKYSSANVNMKLLLDHLFINLPYLQ